MEFARKELLKYGWTEGKGLGLQENGMVNALKPVLKFDKAGIGHDPGEQFTNNWWDIAYTTASSNIKVSETEKGIELKAEEESVNITTRKSSLNKLRKDKMLHFGNFIQTATLTSGGEVRNTTSTSCDAETTNSSLALTDEELFRVCGGRTAHKAARHGHTLSGKLARIQAHDLQSMHDLNAGKRSRRMKKNHHSSSEVKSDSTCTGGKYDISKSRRTEETDNTSVEDVEQEAERNSQNNTDPTLHKKKKRRKN